MEGVLGPEVRPQRNDEVVDAVGGVVRRQDDGLVLPVVLAGVSVRAVFANLNASFARVTWFSFVDVH